MASSPSDAPEPGPVAAETPARGLPAAHPRRRTAQLSGTMLMVIVGWIVLLDVCLLGLAQRGGVAVLVVAALVMSAGAAVLVVLLNRWMSAGS
jgi:hypothetical protein